MWFDDNEKSKKKATESTYGEVVGDQFSRCYNHSTSVLFIYLSPGGYRDVRLGVNGADEVKNHVWFQNDLWTWTNIHQQATPFEPSDDTNYYKMIDKRDCPESS